MKAYFIEMTDGKIKRLTGHYLSVREGFVVIMGPDRWPRHVIAASAVKSVTEAE